MEAVTNRIKELVSKNKRRYRSEGFDLDLTCILYLNLSTKNFGKESVLLLFVGFTKFELLVIC